MASLHVVRIIIEVVIFLYSSLILVAGESVVPVVLPRIPHVCTIAIAIVLHVVPEVTSPVVPVIATLLTI